MAQRISIVDYGMGNLRSVQKALAHVAPGDAVQVTSDPDAIRRADRVVFPGQGAMPDCMRSLEASGLGQAVAEAARARPFLGLCIGQQMLFERSAEGDTPGLALLGGRVVGFDVTPERRAGGMKVPPSALMYNNLHQIHKWLYRSQLCVTKCYRNNARK
jgi:glutamine amidotransferase